MKLEAARDAHFPVPPSVFACPACHAPIAARPGACASCGRRVGERDGLLDFACDLGLRPGLAQRFMESRAVARIYERRFRPLFTRLGSPIRYAEEVAYLARRFRPVGAAPVLDLACGTGRYARLLAGELGAERVIGLDLSAPMLAQAHATAQRQGLAIRFVRGSAQALPFARASLGGVNCFGALHLFPDPAGAIREIARVLAPGGSFTCLTSAEAPAPAARLAQRAFSRAFAFRFFAPGELERALASAALELEDASDRGMVKLLTARRSKDAATGDESQFGAT